MADLYGTDVYAIEDLPDPEQLVSGPLNLACALARRLLEPPDARAEIGDLRPYACLDLREWLGKRVDDAMIADLQLQCNQILSEDERVDSIDCAVTFAGGELRVTATGHGGAGPFKWVLSVSQVSGAQLFLG